MGSLNRKWKPSSLSLLVVMVVHFKVDDELLTVCFESSAVVLMMPDFFGCRWLLAGC